MKVSSLNKGLSLSIFLCMIVLGMDSAAARDTRHMYPLSDALNNGQARSKITGDIKFYFGGQKHPRVLKNYGEYQSNKKTNAFNKTDKFACEWAFLSAMMSFQDRARQLNANAVINIKSYYKKNKISSATRYECGAGGIIAGVTFKGDFVKLAKGTSNNSSSYSNTKSSTRPNLSSYPRETVKAVQLELNKRIYKAGTADGLYGGKTREAVKQFQKDNSIGVTGELNEKTLKLLDIDSGSGKLNSSTIKSSKGETKGTPTMEESLDEPKASSGQEDSLPESKPSIPTGDVVEAMTSALSVFVFEQEDPFSEIQTTLGEGEQVSVLQSSGDWSLIRVGGVEGYVYTEDLQF